MEDNDEIRSLIDDLKKVMDHTPIDKQDELRQIIATIEKEIKPPTTTKIDEDVLSFTAMFNQAHRASELGVLLSPTKAGEISITNQMQILVAEVKKMNAMNPYSPPTEEHIQKFREILRPLEGKVIMPPGWPRFTMPDERQIRECFEAAAIMAHRAGKSGTKSMNKPTTASRRDIDSRPKQEATHRTLLEDDLFLKEDRFETRRSRLMNSSINDNTLFNSMFEMVYKYDTLPVIMPPTKFGEICIISKLKSLVNEVKKMVVWNRNNPPTEEQIRQFRKILGPLEHIKMPPGWDQLTMPDDEQVRRCFKYASLMEPRGRRPESRKFTRKGEFYSEYLERVKREEEEREKETKPQQEYSTIFDDDESDDGNLFGDTDDDEEKSGKPTKLMISPPTGQKEDYLNELATSRNYFKDDGFRTDALFTAIFKRAYRANAFPVIMPPTNKKSGEISVTNQLQVLVAEVKKMNAMNSYRRPTEEHIEKFREILRPLEGKKRMPFGWDEFVMPDERQIRDCFDFAARMGQRAGGAQRTEDEYEPWTASRRDTLFLEDHSLGTNRSRVLNALIKDGNSFNSMFEIVHKYGTLPVVMPPTKFGEISINNKIRLLVNEVEKMNAMNPFSPPTEQQIRQFREILGPLEMIKMPPGWAPLTMPDDKQIRRCFRYASSMAPRGRRPESRKFTRKGEFYSEYLERMEESKAAEEKVRRDISTLFDDDDDSDDFYDDMFGARADRLARSLQNGLKRNIMLAYDEKKENASHTVVFVWDLDEMTMMSKMEEISEKRPDIDAMSLDGLIDRVLMSVDISNPDEVDGKDVLNIRDALIGGQFHGSKLYFLQNLYEAVAKEKKNDDPLISHELLERCGLRKERERLNKIASDVQSIQHQRWQSVKKSLEIVNKRSNASRVHNYANVVLCERGVAQAAAELLVSGLAPSVPIENIFSKQRTLVWRRIQERFGESCRLIYITSNIRSCPRDFGVRACEVNYDGSIDCIYNAQRDSLK